MEWVEVTLHSELPQFDLMDMDWIRASIWLDTVGVWAVFIYSGEDGEMTRTVETKEEAMALAIALITFTY